MSSIADLVRGAMENLYQILDELKKDGTLSFRIETR